MAEHSESIGRKSKGRRRMWAAIALLVFCLLGVGLWWLPTGSGSNDGKGMPVDSTGRLLLTHFALFRTPSEGLPVRVRRILGQHVALRFDLAQRLPIQDRRRYWAVPGNRELCLLAEIGGSSFGTVCTSALHLLEHGVVMTSLSRKAGGGRNIVGIAPDGIRQVVLRSKHRTDVAEVTNGLFTRSDQVNVPVDRVILR